MSRSAKAAGLLARADDILRNDVAELIIAHSLTRGGDGERGIPIPGTLASDLFDVVEESLDLIRDIGWHLSTEKGYVTRVWPNSWLDDLLAFRGGWEGGVR
jgi:hypothetical protein